MYQRILIAVDGSPSSDLAIAQAILIAKATGAAARVVFVADDSELFFEFSHRDPDALMEEIISFGRNVLANAARRISAEGVRCTTRLFERPVSPGRISETILFEAGNWNADLIAMGTHGRRGIRGLVMGGVSEGVVHQTNLPVLLIHSEPKNLAAQAR